MFETLKRKLRKIIERLGRLVDVKYMFYKLPID
jgi:hypothetical protein